MGPMKNQRQLYLEAQGTQCPNSGRDLPIDLLMEILARVPATSIARFSSVSKLWRYILSLASFTELFLTMSSRRPPLLLFTFENRESIFFFSAPLPQNPGDDSSLVPARYHVHRKSYPEDFSIKVCSPLGGFICRQDKGKVATIVVSNPVTGESIFLPEMKSKHLDVQTRPFLGYDPINKQFKVLCIKSEYTQNTSDDHQILTLGDKKHLWRVTLCKPHFPKSNEICIDGVLYYTAGFDLKSWVSMIVCFDVRSETFSFINIDPCMLMIFDSTLINYKGKLAALQFTLLSNPRCLQFWVLEDAGKCKWSKCVYTIPPFWNNIVGRSDLNIVGVTSGGEVVFATLHLLPPFYIYYYNPRGNTFIRVLIRGLEGFVRARVHTSLDYAENFKHI